MDFKIFGYVVSISWKYEDDKWIGYDSYDQYQAIGLGFCTICTYKDD